MPVADLAWHRGIGALIVLAQQTAGMLQEHASTMRVCGSCNVQEGLANVCLVGASITVVAAKVEGSIPRKRGAAAAGYDKALDRFFDKASAWKFLLHAILCC
jgi:hypothetical protein